MRRRECPPSRVNGQRPGSASSNRAPSSTNSRTARYPSDTIEVTAETDDKLVMGLSHKTLPVHGVQFHPESIASENGHLILKNFLDLAAAWNAKQGRSNGAAQSARRRA